MAYFYMTCAKMIGEKIVSYVETVQVTQDADGRCSAQSDLWGRDDRKFPDARSAAMGLSDKALASVRKVEQAT